MKCPICHAELDPKDRAFGLQLHACPRLVNPNDWFLLQESIVPRPPALNDEEVRTAEQNFSTGRHKPQDTALIILLGRALKRPASEVSEEYYELHRMVKKHISNLPSHMEG